MIYSSEYFNGRCRFQLFLTGLRDFMVVGMDIRLNDND